MTNTAIRVSSLIKDFDIYRRPSDLARELITRRPRHTTFRAIDGLSFEVARGEVVGIIGANGAGKSTLLKVITGVLEPTSGQIEVNGKVTAILELGLGFNAEYSGLDNIKLSGLLYGMTVAEVEQKTQSIIDFSGLKEFIDHPVKTYSSGMQSRLAFSIATAVDPDILIIDEALAAGDSAFVQKCLRRIRHLCAGGRTVLLVSHGTGLLAQLCHRVIWLEKGRIRKVGTAIEVVQAYDLSAHQSADPSTWIEKVDDSLVKDPTALAIEQARKAALHAPSDVVSAQAAADSGQIVFRRGPVFIDSVEMLDHTKQSSNRLVLLKPFTLKIHYRTEGPLPTPTLGVALSVNQAHDLSAVAQCYTQNIRPYETRESYAEARDRRPPYQRGTIELFFPSLPFRKGQYLLSLGLLPNEPATWEFYEYRHFFYPFSVDDAGMDLGAPVFLSADIMHVDRDAVNQLTEGSISTAATERATDPTGGEPKTLREEIDLICKVEGGYPGHWMEHEKCPACDVAALTPAFEKYGFRHDRCNACGFVCVNPFPPASVTDKLYRGLYYSRVREHYELPQIEKGESPSFSAPRTTLERIVSRVSSVGSQGLWLDVGGGLGAFARFVHGTRPGWRVCLNEMNPISVEIARSRWGLEATMDSPQALRAAGRSFDVISSLAVVEHIPEPLGFLRDYGELVRPGGWLVVNVPHFTHLNSQVSRGSSPNVVPPFHASLFNVGSLRCLLQRLPEFELVSIEQDGPAAFNPMEHLAYGDMWDITIPTQVEPTPRSLQIQQPTEQMSKLISVLADVAPRLTDYFAEHDGRQQLVAFCRKAGGGPG